MARRHWQQAHARYSELGVPEADNILAHLAALKDAPTNANENLPMDDRWGMDLPVPRHARQLPG